MIDVVQLFKDKATIKEWRFVYGAKEFHNFEVNGYDLAPNEEVLLMFPMRITPQLEDGFWSRYRVNTQLWLCRKSEDDTESSIGEVELEKYFNRLRDLSTNLDNFLKEIMLCTKDPQIQAINVSYFRELNTLSASIDGVTADITFDIW